MAKLLWLVVAAFLGPAPAMPLTISAGVPSLVTATSKPNQYVYFPQSLAWFGSNLVVSHQADSDALHDAGWTGMDLFSPDGGASWKPINMSYSPWLFKPCLPPKGSGAGAAAARVRVTCFEYPLRRTMNASDNTRAELRSTIFETSAATGVSQVGVGVATLQFPPARALSFWGNHTFMMVTDGGVMVLKDGSLLMTLYGNYATDGPSTSTYSIVAVKSTDGGESWQWLSTVSHGAPAPCNMPSEHHCLRRSDDSLYCVFRSTGAQLCSAASTDEGKTWVQTGTLSATGTRISSESFPRAPSSTQKLPGRSTNVPPLLPKCQALVDAYCSSVAENGVCINATKEWYPDALPFYAVDGPSCEFKGQLPNGTCTTPVGPDAWRCYSHIALNPSHTAWSPTAAHPNAFCSDCGARIVEIIEGCQPLPPTPPPPPPASPSGVEPKIAKLPNGKVVISTGRPGLFVWVAENDHPSANWTAYNLAAHHNAAYPDASLHYASTVPGDDATTAYTGLVTVPGENAVIISYDRLGNGWDPANWPTQKSAIFAVKLTIT